MKWKPDVIKKAHPLFRFPLAGYSHHDTLRSAQVSRKQAVHAAPHASTDVASLISGTHVDREV
jgi:hypothetical protein